MINALKLVTIQRGHDPRDYVLYAYGGAGPVHAFGYAAESGVREVIIPLGNGASTLSAYGIASGDVVLYKELERGLLAPFEGEQADALAAGVAEVAAAARADLAAAGFGGGDVIVGLFNTNYGQPEKISTSAKALGLSGHGPYQVQDIYGDNSDLCAPGSVDTANPTPTSVRAPLCGAGTPASFETAGTISANVPPEGVAFYKITPSHAASPATPSGSSSSRAKSITTTCRSIA